MKSLYAFLALACVGASLPACTVHRHYYAPGYGPGGVREYHTTDTVYVNTGSTTIINQSGTVGAPQGGYGTGPVRTSPPPPPPRTNGNYPPPRNNGGVRTPPPTRQPTAGTNLPPAGPGRQPTTGTTPPPPAGGQPGNTSQPPVTSGPGRTPGSPAPTGSPSTGTPASGGTLGGVKTPSTGGTTGTGSTLGGIKTPSAGTTGGNPTGTPGSLSGSVGNSGSNNSGGATTGGSTLGGVKTGSGSAPGGQGPTGGYATGGIKPIPTATGQPTAAQPVGPETGSTVNGGIRTGGIKPSRGGDLTVGSETPVAEYPTGGIKPIPPSATPGNGAGTAAPSDNVVHTGIRTGGIKPSRGSAPTVSSETPAAPGGGLTVGGEAPAPGTAAPSPTSSTPQVLGSSPTKSATPALMFSKMPCRGTCPSYTATIWPDGRVLYVGQQNVAHLGTYELRMEPATVADLQQQARQANFPSLAASYTSGATDIPATVLTMYGEGGSPKTVTVEDGAPADVQALFDYVNGTINQLVARSEFSEQRATPRRGR